MATEVDKYDFAGDERWITYEQNLYIPDGRDRDAILRKKKVAWYQRNVNPDYTESSRSSASDSTSSNDTSSARSSPPPPPYTSTSTSSSSSSSSSSSYPSYSSSSSASAAASASSESSTASRGARSGPGYYLRVGFAYIQLLNHIFITVLSVFVILPFISPFNPVDAFYCVLLLSLAQQGFAVFRVHGRPRWAMEYLGRLLMDEEFQFLCYAGILFSATPFTFAVAPITARSILFIALALEQIGPKFFPSLYSNFRDRVRMIADHPSDVLNFVATMEIYAGLMLLLQLVTPARNVLLLILFWQYLRVRYMTSSSCKLAFNAIRTSLDRALLGPNTYCPRPIGTIYQKIVDFMSRMGDMNAARNQSCTIM